MRPSSWLLHYIRNIFDNVGKKRRRATSTESTKRSDQSMHQQPLLVYCQSFRTVLVNVRVIPEGSKWHQEVAQSIARHDPSRDPSQLARSFVQKRTVLTIDFLFSSDSSIRMILRVNPFYKTTSILTYPFQRVGTSHNSLPLFFSIFIIPFKILTDEADDD